MGESPATRPEPSFWERHRCEMPVAKLGGSVERIPLHHGVKALMFTSGRMLHGIQPLTGEPRKGTKAQRKAKAKRKGRRK